MQAKKLSFLIEAVNDILLTLINFPLWRLATSKLYWPWSKTGSPNIFSLDVRMLLEAIHEETRKSWGLLLMLQKGVVRHPMKDWLIIEIKQYISLKKESFYEFHVQIGTVMIVWWLHELFTHTITFFFGYQTLFLCNISRQIDWMKKLVTSYEESLETIFILKDSIVPSK